MVICALLHRRFLKYVYIFTKCASKGRCSFRRRIFRPKPRHRAIQNANPSKRGAADAACNFRATKTNTHSKKTRNNRQHRNGSAADANDGATQTDRNKRNRRNSRATEKTSNAPQSTESHPPEPPAGRRCARRWKFETSLAAPGARRL